MPWFRVDDNLAFHSKTLAAGNAAMGLWVRAGSWSMQQLTDGHVPDHVAKQLGTRAEAKRLCDVGLWTANPDGGFDFHQWEGRQPTAADVKRAAEAKGTAGERGNHLRWHARRGVVADDCAWCLREAK